MVTREEAVQQARQWLADAHSDTPIDIYEFDLGYVVWPRLAPLPADPRVLPDLGGARGVVDRETGELSTWPLMPPEVIADRYRAAWRARRRFPPLVYDDLRAAGWRPGRDVYVALDSWVRSLDIERTFAVFPAARAALREFGSLTIPQRGPTGLPGKGWTSKLQPLGYRPTPDGIVHLGRMLGVGTFPLGENADGPSYLVIDEPGRVFRLHPVDWFCIGESIDEALVWMTQGGDVPVLDDYGNW